LCASFNAVLEKLRCKGQLSQDNPSSHDELEKKSDAWRDILIDVGMCG